MKRKLTHHLNLLASSQTNTPVSPVGQVQESMNLRANECHQKVPSVLKQMEK